MSTWQDDVAEALGRNATIVDASGVETREIITVADFGIGSPYLQLSCVNDRPVAGCDAGTLLFDCYEWSPPGQVKVRFTHRTLPWNEVIDPDGNSYQYRDAGGASLYQAVDFEAAFGS